LSAVESYKSFSWLQEVGFLMEVRTTREEFLPNFLNVLRLTTPKAEMVSSPTELDREEKAFIAGYPYDDDNKHSFIVHAWNGLV
jgi:CHASE1-domain containing sensor protein